MKQGRYSVGAIYLTVSNNPHSKRYLREETFLLAILPGPTEPSLEELNHVLDIFVPELKELYEGTSVLSPTCLTYIEAYLSRRVHGHFGRRTACIGPRAAKYQHLGPPSVTQN